MEHPHVVIEVAKQVENNMEHPYVLLEIAKQLDNSTRIVFSQTNKTIYNTIKYYFRKEVAISAYLGKVLLFQWSSLDGSEDKDFIKTACINFLKWLLDCDDFKKYLDNISEGAININSRKVNQMSDYVKDKIIPHVKRVLEASKDELTGNWVNLNLEAAHYIVNYWNQLYYDYNLNTYKTLNGWFHPTIINTPFFDYSYSSYLECEKNWKKTLLVINLKKTDTTPTDLRLMYTFICDVYSVGTNGSKYEGDGIRRFSSIVGVNFYNGDKDIVSNTRSHMLCVDYRIPNVDVNFYKIVDTLHVAYPSTAGIIFITDGKEKYEELPSWEKYVKMKLSKKSTRVYGEYYWYGHYNLIGKMNIVNIRDGKGNVEISVNHSVEVFSTELDETNN